MAEKSTLGIVEILLHVFCAAISLGVLIASAVTITSVNDIFDDDIANDSDVGRDRDRYRAVAGWLLFVGIAGIITQVIFAIVRGLFYGEVIISQFIAFGVVCITFTVLLAVALFAGGAASAANAADVQDDYIDILQCDETSGNSVFESVCDDLEQLRNSQAAAAALSFLGTLLCGVLTVVLLVNIVTRREMASS